jgi:hypothetical protein
MLKESEFFIPISLLHENKKPEMNSGLIFLKIIIKKGEQLAVRISCQRI